MNSPRSARYDAVVIGAGVDRPRHRAWRAAARGLSRARARARGEPGAGASGVAAGMLAPVTEADFGEEALLRLNLAGRERWPAFAAELEERTGPRDGLPRRAARSVVARRPRRGRGAAPPARAPALARARRGVARARAAAARLEPALSPRVAGGVLAAGGRQADPRAALTALAAAVERARAAAPRSLGDRATTAAGSTGVRTAGGTIVRAEQVVVAAGAWSPAGWPPSRAARCGRSRARSCELRARAGCGEPLDADRAHARAATWSAARRRRAWWSARPSRSRASTPPSPPAACSSCCATAWRGASRASPSSSWCGRRRPAPGHPRQRAGDRARRARRAASGRPATGATACCSRRSPARRVAGCWPAASRRPSSRVRARSASRPRAGVRRERSTVNGERARAAGRRHGGARGARGRAPSGGRGVAVAVDGEVVPRGEWDDHGRARRAAASRCCAPCRG